MLNVKTSAQAQELLARHFCRLTDCETADLSCALGRSLCENIVSREYIPDFNRSTVDGYALVAADTFGCSENTPALLRQTGQVLMGQPAELPLSRGECIYVPTGGQLPAGADAMVMLEYAEELGDGMIAIQNPAAPGINLVFRGDDLSLGQSVFTAGHILEAKDIGALAAMGYGSVPVFCRPRVAVLSTGDEIVPPETPVLSPGQMRDVNAPMLSSAVAECGGRVSFSCIVPDTPEALGSAVEKALAVSDLVILSGGSSVGERDAAAQVLSKMGQLLFHGLALKPGKPTLAAEICGKPVFGLPGHPVAAYFVFRLFVRPLLFAMTGSKAAEHRVSALCGAAIPSNHGREECVPVKLEGELALPIFGKSGLIATLSSADGYIRIPRDAEGLSQGDRVSVLLF